LVMHGLRCEDVEQCCGCFGMFTSSEGLAFEMAHELWHWFGTPTVFDGVVQAWPMQSVDVSGVVQGTGRKHDMYARCGVVPRSCVELESDKAACAFAQYLRDVHEVYPVNDKEVEDCRLAVTVSELLKDDVVGRERQKVLVMLGDAVVRAVYAYRYQGDVNRAGELSDILCACVSGKVLGPLMRQSELAGFVKLAPGSPGLTDSMAAGHFKAMVAVVFECQVVCGDTDAVEDLLGVFQACGMFAGRE